MTSPPKGWAGFGALQEAKRQREENERERANLDPVPTESVPTKSVGTKSVPTTSVPTESVPTKIVRTKSVATRSVATKTGVATKSTDGSVQNVATPDSVPTLSDGQWTAYLNDFWDTVVPTLKPLEAIALGQLIRLTVGFTRPDCLISLPRLAERCNVHKNTLRPAIRQLVLRGLVIQQGANLGSGNDDRASTYRVNLPVPRVERTKSVATNPVPTKSVATDSDPMIHDYKKDYSATSVYDVRTMAARLWEASGHTLTAEELRTKLRDALTAEGRTIDEATLEQATRGMSQGT
jgi:hypothetical protein